MAYFLKYDSEHGKLDIPIAVDRDFLIVGDQRFIKLVKNKWFLNVF